MVFRHVERFAIAQQVDLGFGDFALRFHPKGKVFERSDVSAISPGLEGAPIPTRSEPIFVTASFELKLERRMAAVSFNGLWSDRAGFWVGPTSTLVCLFTIPDDNLLYEFGPHPDCAEAES
jgi:hypothetical protein